MSRFLLKVPNSNGCKLTCTPRLSFHCCCKNVATRSLSPSTPYVNVTGGKGLLGPYPAFANSSLAACGSNPKPLMGSWEPGNPGGRIRSVGPAAPFEHALRQCHFVYCHRERAADVEIIEWSFLVVKTNIARREGSHLMKVGRRIDFGDPRRGHGILLATHNVQAAGAIELIGGL